MKNGLLTTKSFCGKQNVTTINYSKSQSVSKDDDAVYMVHYILQALFTISDNEFRQVLFPVKDSN